MNNGHLLKGLTESQIITMYKEKRLPNGWIADDESPNELHPIENVVEVKADHSDHYHSLAAIATEQSKEQNKTFLEQIEVNPEEIRNFGFVIMCIGFLILFLAMCSSF